MSIPHLLAFELIYAALAVLLAVMAIVYAYFRHLVRTQFPSAWREMGEPTYLNQSLTTTWKTFRYIIVRAEYKKLDSRAVKVLGDAVRIAYFVFMGIFIYGVVLFFKCDPSSKRLAMDKDHEEEKESESISAE